VAQDRADAIDAHLRVLGPAVPHDRVQVLWWRRETWGNPGPFGREVMPLDEALAFVAAEGFFWIHAS
jgi:hypothetical protein